MSDFTFFMCVTIGYFSYSVIMLIMFWRKCERAGAKGEIPGFLFGLILYPLVFAKIVLVYGESISLATSLLLALTPAVLWLGMESLTKDPLFSAIHDPTRDAVERAAYRKSRERNSAVYILSLAVVVLCLTANMHQTVPRNSPVETISGQVKVFELFGELLFKVTPAGASPSEEKRFLCGRGRASVCLDGEGARPAHEVWSVSYVRNPETLRHYAISVEVDGKVLRTKKEGWALYTRSTLYDVIAVVLTLAAAMSLLTYFKKPK